MLTCSCSFTYTIFSPVTGSFNLVHTFIYAHAHHTPVLLDAHRLSQSLAAGIGAPGGVDGGAFRSVAEVALGALRARRWDVFVPLFFPIVFSSHVARALEKEFICLIQACH